MCRTAVLALLLAPVLLPAAEKSPLPAAWHGEWSGELVVFAPDGKATNVPLTLVIAPIDNSDALTWKAIHGGRSR